MSEERLYWIIKLTQEAILRRISLDNVTEEIMWFSDRLFLSEQLTADIFFGGINDIPEQLDHIYHFLTD